MFQYDFDEIVKCPDCDFSFQIQANTFETGECACCNKKFIIDSYGEYSDDKYYFIDWNI
jgi:hypothetical protein